MLKSALISITSLFISVQIVQAKELALIIGIDSYAELPSLNKALEDATGYNELFTSKGYDVTFLENPTSASMRIELAQFYDKIEPGDTVAFIYSGHGWSDGTLNYLVPSDTPDVSSTTIAAELSVPLKNGVNGVLDRISAQGAGLTLAIVDACRNNPFSGAETRALGVIGGLAPVEPPSGTFIIYSAASNQTALDRLGEADTQQYSVFTRFFLPNLRDLGDLRTAIVETRGQVRAAANIIGHRQRPAYYDELTGSSCLFGDCTPVNVVTESQAALTWSFIKDTTDPVVLNSFIERFNTSDPDLTLLARSAFNQISDTQDIQPAPAPEPPQEAEAQVRGTPIKTEQSSAAETAFKLAQQRIGNSDGQIVRLNDLADLLEIPPEIQGLKELVELDISGTSITDLTPLIGLDLMERLILANTSISNIDPVSHLSSLEYLDLSNSRVSDITILYTLQNLAEPEMEGTPLEELRDAANHNLDIGDAYLFGEGQVQNSETAFQYYQQAYVQYDWSGFAANQLGLMYEEGDGVAENNERAVEYYHIATSRNNGDAAFDLALMHEWGEGVEQDFAASVEWSIQSLKLGSDLVVLRAEGETDLEDIPIEIAKGIQIALEKLGVYNGAIDGNLGPQSRASMLVLCNCE